MRGRTRAVDDRDDPDAGARDLPQGLGQVAVPHEAALKGLLGLLTLQGCKHGAGRSQQATLRWEGTVGVAVISGNQLLVESIAKVSCSIERYRRLGIALQQRQPLP